MMVEHNQSKYYKVPYPTTNTGTYDNKFKFNGKELDDATQMYYYGARYYDPRISIFVSVDPLAEQTMEPYLYTGNNPIMFTDPTGMEADAIDGPGDEFKTYEEAIKDFGMEYNGFSIARDIEVSTLFYTYTGENDETFFSYIRPHVGANGGMGKSLTNEHLQTFAKGKGHKNATFFSDGHTHGSGFKSVPMEEFKRDSYPANEFSLGDIQFYTNHPGNKNSWGRRINGAMISPTGEAFMFNEADHPEINHKLIDMTTSKSDVMARYALDKINGLSNPIFGGLPSDKIFQYSRSGNNSNYDDPKVLPVGFNKDVHIRRKGY